MLFAFALAVPAMAAVSYSVNTQQPLPSLLVPLGLVGLIALAGYVWMRIRIPTADQTLYCVAIVLMGIGLVVGARLDPARFNKQLIWTSLAIASIVFTAVFVRRPEKLAAYQYVSGALALVLVLLPALLHRVVRGGEGITADEVNGARLWIQFGPYFSVQPAEFAKILLAVFLAGYLIEKGEALAHWPYRVLGMPAPPLRHAAPIIILWLASLGLLAAQKDLGCALLVFCLFLAMLYSATGRLGYPVVGLLFFAGSLWLLMRAGAFSHVQTRVHAWLNPWDDPHGAGYQIIYSLFAFAQGDVLGTGLGRGMPTSIPEVSTDFVFAAIAEELGLLGACAVLLCFAILVVRGFVAAGRAKDDFCALLCAGLTAGLVTQAAIIVMGVTKFLPMTGITLPFVSYGGSSVLASGIVLGLMLRISADPSPIPRPAGDRPRTSPLAWIHLAIFLVLSVWLGYWQIWRGPALNVNPLNPRLAKVEATIERGRILDRDGAVLASTDPKTKKRLYPGGRAASHVVGYRSRTYGSTGAEADAAGWLLGLDQRDSRITDFITQVQQRSRSLPQRGDDVRLTIDLRLQQRGHELLGSRNGAIAAIDPQTGAVLCLVSRPTYDPDKLEGILKAASRQGSDKGGASSVLLNRATHGLYPPGSTFKMLVLAAALDAGVVRLGDTFDCAGEEVIDHDRIRCMAHEGHGTITVQEALTKSCNIAFAKIGRLLGPQRFVQYCQEFGFGLSPPGFGIEPSRVPSEDKMTAAMVLESSFGQGALQVTPIEMAMIAGGIANRGQVMVPQDIAEVRRPDGTTVYRMEPKVWRNAVGPDAARQVADLMRRVVSEGTGRGAAISGIPVAGKTGTAENPSGAAHAWFACFAPADDPRIALAVVVEHGGGGGAIAAPIARELVRTYLRK